tara:strand:+ start:24255 stop:24527 length:273 start_codon:yes stop_codon:yes gene_type:complete
MDFLDDLELYSASMYNAYDLITRKKTLDDIYYDLEEKTIDEYPLPFDPFEEDGRTEDVLDIVIEYFTDVEEYEKCLELLEIKKECRDSKT